MLLEHPSPVLHSFHYLDFPSSPYRFQAQNLPHSSFLTQLKCICIEYTFGCLLITCASFFFLNRIVILFKCLAALDVTQEKLDPTSSKGCMLTSLSLLAHFSLVTAADLEMARASEVIQSYWRSGSHSYQT